MMKKQKRTLKAWTAADIRQLRALARAKLSARKIAGKLRRSTGAVSQKALRLGVRFRSVNRRRRRTA